MPPPTSHLLPTAPPPTPNGVGTEWVRSGYGVGTEWVGREPYESAVYKCLCFRFNIIIVDNQRNRIDFRPTFPVFSIRPLR